MNVPRDLLVTFALVATAACASAEKPAPATPSTASTAGAAEPAGGAGEAKPPVLAALELAEQLDDRLGDAEWSPPARAGEEQELTAVPCEVSTVTLPNGVALIYLGPRGAEQPLRAGVMGMVREHNRTAPPASTAQRQLTPGDERMSLQRQAVSGSTRSDAVEVKFGSIPGGAVVLLRTTDPSAVRILQHNVAAHAPQLIPDSMANGYLCPLETRPAALLTRVSRR